MKLVFVVLSVCFSIGAYAQEQVVKMFYERKDPGPGSIIYASNSAYSPVSATVEFELVNMKFSDDPKKVFVIPARTERFKIGEVDVVNTRAAYRYGYRFKFNYGDITLMSADTSVVYDLPFAKDKTFRIFQGYNGSFSHRNENAIDFTMPEGTEIYAARDGIVVRVVQENNQSCGTQDCAKYNNYITIYHEDGSFAEYTHIKFNGAAVKIGDKVKKGDLIAYSGNTGWSNGPHLHFVAFLPGMEKRRSIPTKFRVNEGVVVSSLEEKQSYRRGY